MRSHAVRLGLARGWHEFRLSLTSVDELIWNVLVAVGLLAVLYFQRDSTVRGTEVSLAFSVLPSMLGMMVAFGGLQGAAGALAVEREDGTLLRARALPHGIIGYLTGRVVSLSLGSVLSLAIVLIPAPALLPELADVDVTGWLTLAGVIPLGLLATLPWGAIVGAIAKSPQGAFGLVMLPAMGATAISGIFYPIFALPGWAQGLAQLFPVYWLGLGMRSALLPDAAAAVEIGDSWRHLETLAVLGVWAGLGLLLAPLVLRRMARKESGSSMAERRHKALQRIG